MPISQVKRTHTCHGVSCLEVMLCLALIGCLLALLLPRLAALNDAVRSVRLRRAMAQVQVAAGLFHVRCEAARSRGAADCTRLVLGGQPVAGVQSWPAASVDGIVQAAALPLADASNASGFAVWRGLVDGVPALFIGLKDRRCEFFYVQAMGPGVVPVVDIVDASCN